MSRLDAFWFFNSNALAVYGRMVSWSYATVLPAGISVSAAFNL